MPNGSTFLDKIAEMIAEERQRLAAEVVMSTETLTHDGARHAGWQPDELLDIHLGVTMDDHCVVVLVDNGNGRWTPTTHLPQSARAALVAYLGRCTEDSLIS